MLLPLVIASLLAAGINADLAADADKYLLPWNIRPEHYDLTLFTHMEYFDPADNDSFGYSGSVDINFVVLYGDQSEVVLHTYDDMSISYAEIVALDPGKTRLLLG